MIRLYPGGIFGHHIVDPPSNRTLGDADSDCFLAPPHTNSGIGEQAIFVGGDQGHSTSGCINYIGQANPLASGSGSSNSILSTAKGLPEGANITNDNGPFPVFYNRIGNDSHKSGSIVFTVNTFCPARGNVSRNVVTIPYTQFYYRQPTTVDPNPNWTKLSRSEELNQVGGETIYDDVPSPSNDAFDVPGKFSFPARWDDGSEFGGAGTANITQNRRTITVQRPGAVGSSWTQSVRAFHFDQLYDPTLPGADASLGIEYAIVCLYQKQYFITNSEENENNGIVRSWVVADDLNYPTCAVWQNRNLVNQLEAGKKLFPYYVQQNGGSSSTEWKSTIGGPNTSVTTLYARSPYIDYVDHLYTDETSGVLFIPSSEVEQRINFRQDRTLLVGPDPATPRYTYAYSNNPETNFNNTTVPGQILSNLDLQFNAGFGWSGSEYPGRKLINPGNNFGVGAIRVFNGANPEALEELNIDQNYPRSGTLRVKLN